MKIIRRNAVLSLALAFSASGLAATAHAQAGAPSDPQIVGIVVTANQIDIDAAKLALQKSKNKQVRDFAQQMVDDHTALGKNVGDLVQKLNVTPADNDTSNTLKQQASEETTKLKSLNGKAFDREYIDHEVAYHKAVIDAVSNTLIPNAQNAELKSALQGAAPLFQGHLQHAEQIQSALNGNSNASAHKH
jgi:putative membrane protein